MYLLYHVCEKYARPHKHIFECTLIYATLLLLLCVFAIERLFYHTAEKLIEISGLQR